VDGWLDVDGRTDGRTDGWMDGWMDGLDIQELKTVGGPSHDAFAVACVYM